MPRTYPSRSRDHAPCGAHGVDCPPEADLPSPEALHRLLREAHRPIPIDGLMRMLGLRRRLKKPLEALLSTLRATGRAQRLHGGLWMAAELLGSAEGRYSVSRTGTAQVIPDALPPRGGTARSPRRGRPPGHGRGEEPAEGIGIRPGNDGGAWHGDRVRVALFPRRRGHGPEGRVIEILQRAQQEIAVHVCKPRRKHARALTGASSTEDAAALAGHLLCVPVDPRLPFTLSVDARALPTLPEPGSLLLVRPTEQRTADLWQAVALRAFGREDDIAVQERLVKLNHGAPLDFPPAVVAAAARLPAAPEPADCAGREDVRAHPLVTIDGDDARDFDDAICVTRLPRGGWRLLVAIADVTHYVRPRSPLDTEARERGNSWYFPTSVEPMLPEALSNGLCSLNPGVDRLVMLVELGIDAHGQTRSERFAPGLMRSAARLTYDEVYRALLAGDAGTREAQQAAWRARWGTCADTVCAMLRDALELAQALGGARTQRGSLDFSLPEPRCHIDERGRVSAITRAEPHRAHKLIEECMIAANEAVARFLAARDLPLAYRVHPMPEPEKLEGLWRSLSATALGTMLGQRPTSRPTGAIIRAALDAARGGELEFFTNRLALRAMPQARYEPENTGHFGLASTCYCHFTSPIRRYADIIVHRALKHALRCDDAPIASGRLLLAQCDHLNHCERAAMEAEREMTRRCACLVLRGREGEEFAGMVAAVTDFGCFVELADMPVEGMVPLDSLGDDYYSCDPVRQELVGMGTGARLRLGQGVRVRLERVDLGRLEITFMLVAGLVAGAAPTPGVPGRTFGNTRRGTRAGRPRGGTPTPRTRPVGHGRPARGEHRKHPTGAKGRRGR